MVFDTKCSFVGLILLCFAIGFSGESKAEENGQLRGSEQIAFQKRGLEESIQIALKNSPDLKRSYAEIEQARLNKTEVLTHYLPSLDASFSRLKSESRIYSDEVGSFLESDTLSNRLNLTLTEGIDLQGKTIRSYKRSNYSLKSAEAAHEFKSSEIIKQVIDLFYLLQEARVSQKGYAATKARIKENKSLIETEIALGRRSKTDLGEIDHAAAQNEIKVLKAQQSIRSSLKQLGILLYGSSAKYPYTTDDADLSEPKFVQNWRAKIIEYNDAKIKDIVRARGDITSLENTINAANSLRRENAWKFAPDLNFKVDYSKDFSRTANDDDPSEEDSRLSFGLVASWNLFNGGRDYIQRRKDFHAQASDEFRYRDAFEKAVVEIQEQYEQLITQAKLEAATKILLESAKLKYESIKAQYQYGKISTTDLLKAEVDYAEAKGAVISEKFKFYRQYANLQHLSGKLRSLFN